jgi:hypothetical protein
MIMDAICLVPPSDALAERREFLGQAWPIVVDATLLRERGQGVSQVIDDGGHRSTRLKLHQDRVDQADALDTNVISELR